MIISHKHKFIFIKTQKVSGTSMEIALSHHLGPRDIVTPISIDDEIKRYKLTGKTCQNYSNNAKSENKFIEIIKNLSNKNDLNQEEIHKYNLEYQESTNYTFFNHIKASEIIKKIQMSIWEDYFKFTIERHPFDRVISFMFFANRRNKNFDIEKEINKTIDLKKYHNFPFYTSGRKVLVDKILKYENLQADILELEQKLNLNIHQHYIFTKNKFRNKENTIDKMLTLVQKHKIYQDCKFEFDIMNYDNK